MKFCLLLSIIALALSRSLPAAPPATQPGNHSADWYAGWTAAGGTMGPPAPSAIPTVELRAFITAYIAAHPGQSLTLPLAHYTVEDASSPIMLTGIPVLDGNGSDITGPTIHGTFQIKVENGVVQNFKVLSSPMFVYSTAPGGICRHCDFSGATSLASMGQPGPGGSLALLNCTGGKTSSYGMFVDQSNCRVDGCSFLASAGQYSLRYTADPNGKIPSGLSVTNSSFTGHDPIGKYTIGFRSGSFTIQNCTISGPILTGQIPAKGVKVVPGQYCKDIQIDHCTFNDSWSIDLAHPISFCSVNNGVSGSITNCTFNNPLDVPIVIDADSLISTGGNIVNIPMNTTWKIPDKMATWPAVVTLAGGTHTQATGADGKPLAADAIVRTPAR